MVVDEELPRFDNHIYVFGGLRWEVCVHVPGNACGDFGTDA